MTSSLQSPVIIWFRRDLRLGDNPALSAALQTGKPVICLFIADRSVDEMGACPKWRLGLSLESLRSDIEALGARLVLRAGPALEVLEDVIAQSGADALHYAREYTPFAIARDTEIKSVLSEQGVEVTSHNGSLLFEPWTVQNGAGSFYKVYTPFWKAVRDRDVPPLLERPSTLPAYQGELASENLSDWNFAAAMNRGVDVVQAHICVGEAAAQKRLDDFCASRIGAYKAERDRMDIGATSRLSENLAYGEISPRTLWHQGYSAMTSGAAGAEHFLKEVVWREFAYNLIFHSPHILSNNWKEGFDAFPWREDNADAEAWRRGETGEPVVDAAMREMYVTGTMHNRSRMIVASYLTKHLMVHWKVGKAWFEECLIDWDPASNAMGWQWVAGCGPDASPFFRIFNPETQGEKFDPLDIYKSRFLDVSNAEAKSYYDAIPRSWEMSPDDPRPERMVELKDGRDRALAAYKAYTTPGQEEAAQERSVSA